MSTKKYIFSKKTILFVPIGTEMRSSQSEFPCTRLDTLKYLQQQWLIIGTIKIQGLCQVADFALTKHSFGGCLRFFKFNI